MKRLALWVPPPYENDELFNEAGRLNRDDCLAAFRKLKEAVEANGGQCRTQDRFRHEGMVPDAVLFLDIPRIPINKLLDCWKGRVAAWVLLQEPATIFPQNWDPANHAQFDRIFTWHDPLVDNKKYIKINYGFSLPASIPSEGAEKKKLCTMIAGNKASRCQQELYSERGKTLAWFEENHPEDFDFYGVGWDQHLFRGNRLVRILNRIPFLPRLLADSHPCYRGAVANKVEVLQKYHFAICYENIRDVAGYITEKIFDCFFAGCVPIYWGANNVTDHIPAGCFIDRRNFSDHYQLYRFLKDMPEEIYRSHMENIKGFLSSERAYPFTTDCFAKTILKELKDE